MRKNAKKKKSEGGWGCYNSPLWPRYHPIWFKTSTLKDNCLFKLLLRKTNKKTNISPFAAYTYIHKTNNCYFLTFPLPAFLPCLADFHSHPAGKYSHIPSAMQACELVSQIFSFLDSFKRLWWCGLCLLRQLWPNCHHIKQSPAVNLPKIMKIVKRMI